MPFTFQSIVYFSFVVYFFVIIVILSVHCKVYYVYDHICKNENFFSFCLLSSIAWATLVTGSDNSIYVSISFV